jgi:hypothetical protein
MNSAGGGALGERVNRSPQPGAAQDSQIAAAQMFERLEAALSINAKLILRMLILDGDSGSDAVNSQLGDAQDHVWFAISGYLDELIDAILALDPRPFPLVLP